MRNEENKFIGEKKRSIPLRIFLRAKNSFWRSLTFTFLLLFYLLAAVVSFLCRIVIFSKELRERTQLRVWAFFEKVTDIFENKNSGSIKRTQLIDLSIRNMKVRKARTIITVGGMMVGIGAIVFLVSIGYGLQDLVISRVAKLDEMKQTTVMIQSGSRFPLNDETLANFRELPNVEIVLPVISVVGKVNLNSSVSDMAVYGVTSEYLKRTDIKTTTGGIFDNDEMTKIIPIQDGQAPEIEKQSDQNSEAVEGGAAPVIASKNGATDIPELKYNEKGELVMAAGEQQVVEEKKISLDPSAERKAVVNQAMLQTLGIQEADAVGKKFQTSFVVVGSLLENNTEKIESAAEEYEIIGVVPEGKTPIFYVPFINLRSLGIANYSQVKVSVAAPEDLAKTRKQIEAMGYRTHSVADTVEQINNLFSTARFFLALVGMIALSVAALGMFNTLTVSLLERTREVGLMKAMGMKSAEVNELFLTESMIMGFLGGVLGILLGYVAGKIVGIALSFFSIIKGVGTVSVSSVPLILVFIIVTLSLFVGIITGIYPARRAEKISALNALRYE